MVDASLEFLSLVFVPPEASLRVWWGSRGMFQPSLGLLAPGECLSSCVCKEVFADFGY